MAYEYIISFGTPGWLTTYSDEVLRKIESLPTFVDVAGNAICLLGFEDRDREDRWRFDIRLFLRNDEDLIFLEASAQPASIQRDLTEFINWLDSRTSMRLLDDDGEQIEGVFIRD